MVNNSSDALTDSVGTLPKSKITYAIVGGSPSAAADTLKPLPASSSSTNFEEDIVGKRADKWKVSAWGRDNLFPNKLRSLYNNNIFPGLMDFKVDMFTGHDYYVYQESIVDNVKVSVPVIDPEVEDWLEDWYFFDWLVAQFTDFAWIENAFSQIILDNAGKKVAKLVHVNAEECRLTVRNRTTNAPDRIVVSDWPLPKNYAAYPMFDRKTPLSSKISMYHSKKKSFLFNYYNYPVWIGALQRWIPLADEIPGFHLARMQNSINAKYHVKIPIQSLEELKQLKAWSQAKLDAWLSQKLKDLDDMLAGSANAGKTFYSFKQTDPSGKEVAGWEINEIKNNEKEMSEANLRLFNETNQAITSAVQVQPSLACIQLGEKMSSGSEVLNSYNLHVKTRTTIARKMILRPVNLALAVNWPDKKYKIGIKDAFLVKQETNKNGIAPDTE